MTGLPGVRKMFSRVLCLQHGASVLAMLETRALYAIRYPIISYTYTPLYAGIQRYLQQLFMKDKQNQ